MAVVTNTLLASLRQQLIDKVDHAQFRIGSTYTNVVINEKKINSNGTVNVGFYINASSGQTVTQCRLLDSSNNVLASKSENIVMSQTASAIYYFFTFNVYELTT